MVTVNGSERGKEWPGEARTWRDEKTGRTIRQVTTYPSQSHHPFFFVPAYDRACQRLFFVSHRTGKPQVFFEELASGRLVQATARDDLAEWSLSPALDGSAIYYVAGAGAYRLDLVTSEERQLADFGTAEIRAEGMVGAAMGTTALSASARYWAIPVKTGAVTRFVMVDTARGTSDVFLERDEIGHPQFCPDDEDLILYAGPMTDRIWVTDRSGRSNRRLYARESKEQWVTHESWLPGRRTVLFVDWPQGMRVVDVATEKVSWITRFPAWHAAADDTGSRIVCDTMNPDIGLHLLPMAETDASDPQFLHASAASSVGEHWKGPFPYNNGPIKVYAPQHTHPHPRFSPDGRRVVFTSDRTGEAQVYEVLLDADGD